MSKYILLEKGYYWPMVIFMPLLILTFQCLIIAQLLIILINHDYLWFYVFLVTVTLYMPLHAYWRKAVFRRSDFKQMIKKRSMQIQRPPLFKYIYNIFVGFFQMFATSDRYWIAAEFDSPVTTISVGAHAINNKRSNIEYITSGGSSVPYANYLSTVNFFLLAELPQVGYAEVYINDNVTELPKTGIDKIDNIVAFKLNGVKDAHFILEVNQTYLRLMVIGGAWLGKRYEDRIINAFEMVDDLYDLLQSEYPTNRSFNDYKITSNMGLDSYRLIKT